jgi:competence protein ComGC
MAVFQTCGRVSVKLSAREYNAGRKAFTVVAVLTVIFIIGVLASLLLPSGERAMAENSAV